MRRSPNLRSRRRRRRYGVTPAQVILRWHLQRRSLPLPKSATPQRQRQNLDLFGFELTDAEVDAITALSRPDGRLFGGDPDNHEEEVMTPRSAQVRSLPDLSVRVTEP